MDSITALHAGIAGVGLETANTAAATTDPQPHVEHNGLSESPEHVQIKVEEVETSETLLLSTTTSPCVSSSLASIENQPTAHAIPSWANGANLDGEALSRLLNELVDDIPKMPHTRQRKNLSDIQRMDTIKDLIKRLHHLADGTEARENAHGTKNNISAAGKKRSSSNLSRQEPESSKRQKENTAGKEAQVVFKAEKSGVSPLLRESDASTRKNGAASRELSAPLTKAQVSPSSTREDREDSKRRENFTSAGEHEVLIRIEHDLEQPASPLGPVRERPRHVNQPLGSWRRLNRTQCPSHPPTPGLQQPRRVVPYNLPSEPTRSLTFPPSPTVARGRLLLPPAPSRFLLRASTYTFPLAHPRALSFSFTFGQPTSPYEPAPPVRRSAPWVTSVARQAVAFDRQLETAYQSQRHRNPYVYIPWHHRRKRPDSRDRRWNIFNLGNLGEGGVGELRGRRITGEILVTALCNAPENSGAQRGSVSQERTVTELVQLVKEKRRACRPEEGWTEDWFELPSWTHWWDRMELAQRGH